MNIHPLIVHFPVVLLTIYVVLEIITRLGISKNEKLLWVKQRALWLGTITIFFSLASGEQAEEIVGKSSIVHLHEEFAEMARNIFVMLSLIYLSAHTTTPITQKLLGEKRSLRIKSVFTLSHKYYISLILALVGFVVLVGVGSLGGAITRGVDHDPIAQWMIQTFGK